MSRPRPPARPVRTLIQGMDGIDRVRLLAEIPHGRRGTRQVAVDVSPEEILALAKCLAATANGACGSEDRARRFHVGHAVWHLHHPEDPMPCIDFERGVIDAVASEETALAAAANDATVGEVAVVHAPAAGIRRGGDVS